MKNNAYSNRVVVTVVVVTSLVSISVAVMAFSGISVTTLLSGLGTSTSLSGNSLAFEPETVDLGEVQAGTVVNSYVKVRNTTNRSIIGLKARSDCSCITPNELPLSIDPNEVATIRFSYQAPSVPTSIGRRIKLWTEEDPTLTWQVLVEGSAIASIWSIPTFVKSTLDETGNGTAQVRYGFIEGFSPSKIICDNPNVQIVKSQRSGQMYLADLKISDRQPGAAILQVIDADGNAICETHVSWKSTSKISVVPQTLYLPRGKMPLHFDVYINVQEGMDTESIEIRNLVPWIVSIDRMTIDNRKLHLRLTIDQDATPQSVDEPILAFNVEDQETTCRARRGK